MKTKNILKIIFLFLFIGINAQLSSGEEPYSWSHDLQKIDIKPIMLPNFDLKKIKREDTTNDKNKSIPYRFGYKHSVDYGINNDGQWLNLSNGDRIWRILFKSKGATSLNFIFDEYYIPVGGKVFLYNSDKTDLLGTYTHLENNEKNVLGTWIVYGEEVWIEYYEPKKVKGKGKLHISYATHGYRTKNPNATLNRLLGSSGDCNHDVDCSIGTDWSLQRDINKESVALILNNGSDWCSGALINNTSQNKTPYLLTANHCLGTPSNFSFRFGWISPSPSCGTTSSSSNGPTSMVISGATLKANNSGSDFALLELNSSVPNGWNRVWSGWDRSGDTPPFVVGIHHPSGDIMKICRDNSGVIQNVRYGAQVWEITGAGNGWELGVTEGGSSGSPLFDQNGRIIAQLYGGFAACSGTNDNNTADWYGRFNISWNGSGSNNNRLSNWLDPSNKGIESLKSMKNVSGYDLAGFDSDKDAGEEPNKTGDNIWKSNDIWNRRTNSGLNITHQDPGYLGSNYNIMRFRVHNVSFNTSSTSYAKLYWTLGATGEAWPESWNGSVLINGQPAGGELTSPSTFFNLSNTYVSGLGFQIPPLAPGAEYIIDAKWNPANPTIFGMTGEPMICFLGRIVDANDPMFNENSGPSAPIGPNVRNNNNIVTRNAKLVSLSGTYTKGIGGFLFGNSLKEHAIFNLNLFTDDNVDVPFVEVGRITIQLDERLWDRWIDGGAIGEGIEIFNEQTREILVTRMEHIQLQNIALEPREYLPVNLIFEMNEGYRELQNYHFSVSQELTERPEENYGSECHFLVKLNSEDTYNEGEPFPDEDRRDSSFVQIIPNPNHGKFIVQINNITNGDIQIFNIQGDIIKDVKFEKEGKIQINIEGIKSGLYIMRVKSDDFSDSIKFIIN